ncbi:MAG: precorrin-4 C(11)-methyltransferase, partial [Nitrospirota bacterium]
MTKVFFIGAGPGDPELMTVKARRILSEAGLVIYAGSLVNPEVLKFARPDAVLKDSASMELTAIVETMSAFVSAGKLVARVHTGDPSLYGAIAEQMAELDRAGIPYEVVPGVSSAFAAAAELKCELTLPEVSQTVIFTRLGGRTNVPEKESLASLASHQSTMVIFLSVKNIDAAAAELMTGYPKETPAAVVYKASWPEEKIIRGTLADIAGKVKEAAIEKTALIFVGRAIDRESTRVYSRLYDKDFSHMYRKSDPPERAGGK